jgi:phosphohistidine swiveling domain-containing protein
VSESHDVVDLRDAADVADAGGKARNLARLAAAGLPVPDGFVLTHAVFARVVGAIELTAAGFAEELAALAARAEVAEVPAGLAAAVSARAAALAGPPGALAVRSSVSIEDAATGSAAGVLSSQTMVAPADVWRAIRAVWASACTPLVADYARRQRVARIAVGVIVQRHVDGARLTVYTRAPGRPAADEVWLEPEGGATARTTRGDAVDRRVALALAAEAAIDASLAGADVELVDGAHGLAVVQARPIVHPPERARRLPAPPPLFAPLVEDRGRRWRWDVEHNPAPLSSAQAGLVAAVDAAGVAPYRMCTVAGYLYWAEAVAASAPSSVAAPPTADALRDRFAALAARMGDALAAAGPAPSVAGAVAAYLAFYAIWANEVAPMLAAARRGATRAHGSPIARALGATARGERTRDDLLAELGDLALAWDVAAPTWRESPALVTAAIAAARATSVAPATTLHEVALELGELDDVWFARAQALVRRALLAAGAALGLADPDDVFWLPLDELVAGTELDPIAAAARAAAARSAAARAARWDMPLVVGEAPPGEPPATAPTTWRGAGAGRAIGRVRRLDGASVVAPGTVVVARAITPALALLVHGAAAIASEAGGILSHGAAIARELGIPFLVGCAGAYDALADGDRVELDGDAGVLRRN